MSATLGRGSRVQSSWWAWQDSNLQPRDSLVSPFPAREDYLFIRGALAPVGCGTLLPVIKSIRIEDPAPR